MDGKLLNETDNMGRTCLHYAYALKDKNMIELLESNKINKKVFKSTLTIKFFFES
jgi:hypothetical protein